MGTLIRCKPVFLRIVQWEPFLAMFDSKDDQQHRGSVLMQVCIFNGREMAIIFMILVILTLKMADHNMAN